METHLQQVKNSSQTFSEKQNPKEASPISSPSPSSSPSHDFSFTISLQPLSSSSKHISPTLRNPSKTTSSYQQTDPFAVDLSPADEIFFHGHLLPLHLLSHLPVSPRTSTGSYNDGFALPVRDILPDEPTTLTTTNNVISMEAKDNNAGDKAEGSESDNRVKTKSVKSFSLFGLSKWRKGFESNEREQQQQQQQKKKLMSLDLSHAVKKYIRMLFQRRENGTQFRNRRHTSSYSFSSSIMGSKGNSKAMTNGSRDLIRGRRGELFSAPASMRTSPTNSGHLRVSTAGLSSSSASTSSSSSDSTMEELQAAIQAAIAHCKNSSAVDRDDKVMDS
ncbi:unnamed protein product [Microthlaspi erraticum]|uniref:BRI1 kinase inhibitor 1 n=1 Tax=Microthlaspi erraticum TaxID=1685480 RepID=A0A6D2JYV9_9BRAS|nr:unnamed protein product [Microthlaspi erraticum]